jgi:hypothetical protein
LQPIITDTASRPESLLDVSGFKKTAQGGPLLQLLGVIRPHSGKAIGLKFEPHRCLIGLLRTCTPL